MITMNATALSACGFIPACPSIFVPFVLLVLSTVICYRRLRQVSWQGKIEHIDVPAGWTANVCFGGKDGHTLFITAQKSLYAIQMRVKGVL
jgi:hypothetical protein